MAQSSEIGQLTCVIVLKHVNDLDDPRDSIGRQDCPRERLELAAKLLRRQRIARAARPLQHLARKAAAVGRDDLDARAMAGGVAADVVLRIDLDADPFDDRERRRVGEAILAELLLHGVAVEDHHGGGEVKIHLRGGDALRLVGPGAMAMRHGAAMDCDLADVACGERILDHEVIDREQH